MRSNLRSFMVWGTAAACVIALTAAGASAAKPKAKAGPAFGQMGGRGGGMMMRLGLDDKQRDAFTKLRKAKHSQVVSLRAQLDLKKAELNMLWLQHSLDRAAILAKKDEMRAVHAKIDTINVDFRLNVAKMLTPEQRVMFLQRSGRGHNGWGKGRHGGRGFGKRGFGKRGFGKRGFGKRGFCPRGNCGQPGGPGPQGAPNVNGDFQ